MTVDLARRRSPGPRCPGDRAIGNTDSDRLAADFGAPPQSVFYALLDIGGPRLRSKCDLVHAVLGNVTPRALQMPPKGAWSASTHRRPSHSPVKRADPRIRSDTADSELRTAGTGQVIMRSRRRVRRLGLRGIICCSIPSLWHTPLAVERNRNLPSAHR